MVEQQHCECADKNTRLNHGKQQIAFSSKQMDKRTEQLIEIAQAENEAKGHCNKIYRKKREKKSQWRHNSHMVMGCQERGGGGGGIKKIKNKTKTSTPRQTKENSTKNQETQTTRD